MVQRKYHPLDKGHGKKKVQIDVSDNPQAMIRPDMQAAEFPAYLAVP